MSYVVHKFGGSCLKTESDLFQISDIVNNCSHNPIIVVSAVFGVTNRLFDAIDGCDDTESFIRELQQIHRDISSDSAQVVDSEKFNTLLTRLQYDLELLRTNNDVSIQNRILAFGEKFATLIVANHLRRTLTKSKALWAEEIGIEIIGEGRQRKIDLNTTREGLLQHLGDGKVPVITGWYGTNSSGEIEVLERGGSDVTATAVANIVQAQKVVLWKDVDGILTLHPSLGLEGCRIAYLGYSEASELARLGSTVLHPLCIEPVSDAGIPLELRPIHGGSSGTTIGPDLHLEEPQVKAMVCANPVRLVSISSPIHRRASSITRKVLEILEENEVEAWYLHASPTKIELILDDGQHTESLGTLSRMGFEIHIGDLSAVVSLVGSQIGNWQDGLKEVLEMQTHFHGNYKFINSEGPSLHFLTERNALNEIINHLSLNLGLTQREISN